MAAKVLGVSAAEPADLLSGRRFGEAGIGGLVESDFFDWPLASSTGPDLVRRIALQAGRFRLEDVQTDVLKGLYESLIDPEQRHSLGEYYTPDWLAQRICAAAVQTPLDQRVLDPACGSGTFVFHAVRRLLEAAEQDGVSTQEGITRACRQVFGIDVHPVAVQIARVTFLLAIGQERLKQRPASLNIPVYMGDSLQWNTRGFMAERDVLIEVPESTEMLEFPFEVTRDPALFDSTIRRMLELSQHDATSEGLTAWLQRDHHLGPGALNTLARTYDTLHGLHRAGRNHVWGFVARNLVRPIWLAQEGEKVDVLVGNPPWLSYRFMDADLQKRFRAESQERGLWAGGNVATQQDLSAYFFARCVELYLKASGSIAFVMPYAAMSRRQFEGFRSGVFAERKGKARQLGMVQTDDGRPIEVQERSTGEKHATVQFTDAWIFSDDVKPLFPALSCVLFGHPTGVAGPSLPAVVRAASGTLPRRDASAMEAEAALVWKDTPWPSVADGHKSVSVYSERFKNGATVFPRVLCVVEVAPAGSLGTNPEAPVVQSHRTSQEKQPWKQMGLLRGNVEREFLRPLYLGESVAPFRVLEPGMGVIPWADEEGKLLDSQTAQQSGYVHLAGWLSNAERLWAEHGPAGSTFEDQIDYFGKLSSQFPIAPLRVVYSKAGSLPAAALLSDQNGVVDHKLYWAKVDTLAEGHYLLAILNSETARKAAAHLQSRGQWGARDFDKVILSLPIPKFDGSNKLHKALAKAAGRAEKVAAAVALDERMHFVTARQKIRAALQQDGVAATIDELVTQLLSSQAVS